MTSIQVVKILSVLGNRLRNQDVSLMSKAYAQFDTSSFPIVRVTFTGAQATDENFSYYLAGLEALYAHRKKLVLLFDATLALFPGLRFQKRQAAWMKAHKATIKSYCLGIAYVVPRVWIRQALKMIFILSANPVPFKVFKNRQEAEYWLHEQMRETG